MPRNAKRVSSINVNLMYSKNDVCTAGTGGKGKQGYLRGRSVYFLHIPIHFWGEICDLFMLWYGKRNIFCSPDYRAENFIFQRSSIFIRIKHKSNSLFQYRPASWHLKVVVTMSAPILKKKQYVLATKDINWLTTTRNVKRVSLLSYYWIIHENLAEW